MSKTLVAYTSKNRKYWEGVYGKENTLFLNISRSSIDDLQGMRFEKVVFEEDVTEDMIETISKFKI